MKLRGRVRFGLSAAMALVAGAGLLLGWVAAERRKRIAALTVEYRRFEDRVWWVEQMGRSCYGPSKSQTAAERARLDWLRVQLEGLGVPPQDRRPTAGPLHPAP